MSLSSIPKDPSSYKQTRVQRPSGTQISDEDYITKVTNKAMKAYGDHFTACFERERVPMVPQEEWPRPWRENSKSLLGALK